jgi:predicted HTH domain antitoxin
MRELRLSYPDDLAQAVNLTPEEMTAQVLLMAALKMFELGKLSSSKAAELAGISRVEFLEACGRYHIPIFNYSPEEMPEEINNDLQAINTALWLNPIA